jgi:signal transduction histidine kinase
VQNFRGRTGLEADLVVSRQAGGVPPEIAEVLHAVAREALANVERHAHASAVALHLSVDGRTATLTVQDDGVGAARVVIRTVAESDTHFGLRDLQARLEQVGGTLAVSPGDDGGFVLRASVPLKAPFEA